MLLRVVEELRKAKDPILEDILVPALREPVLKLLHNSGIIDPDEIGTILAPIVESMTPQKDAQGVLRLHPVVFDALEGKHVKAYHGGILDSLPAVLEAIRNSLSIASQMGTIGGVVVFQRDQELERYEATQTADYLREDGGENPADERG